MSEFDEQDSRESIVFVGDSITAGGDWQNWFPEYRVSVEATPGDATDRLNERLPAIIELQPATLAILIEIGRAHD